ncbi:hypothetical protein THASP1DRAFT_31427 [Thamnocephalis sphaerospora]|uniref:SNRNP25 ubiquitin-like domain-containing protein n=1 Tax=Thamnocephalis sphaerospora TaxID=78915 RepID=A0A4P9XLL8_9FUNG|nr:hypothetical protein THASP1DRAFT_31427 [Thamnocephalis sphaerospora]|eukprot:RKP06767.1 hypothetical protein THASP1DRAFT_31427 [Thamnocephalis sphaerospora]
MNAVVEATATLITNLVRHEEAGMAQQTGTHDSSDSSTLEAELAQLEEELATLQRDPLLQDLPTGLSPLELDQRVAYEHGHALRVMLDRGKLGLVEVIVRRAATIGILKQLVRLAIERHLAKRAAPVKEESQAADTSGMSATRKAARSANWTYVWRHHCLALDTQRLLDERARVQEVGLQEGDRLRFIRYVPEPLISKEERAAARRARGRDRGRGRGRGYGRGGSFAGPSAWPSMRPPLHAPSGPMQHGGFPPMYHRR